ncbi:MAG TPA: MFS transporter [Solirubrobacterales bacterium]|nr:MFS transporter [Solirubrobacterales bacterium]
MAKWGVLVALGAAQFLMVLDQAVMNVAISQLVEDFDTTVTTIQMVIAFYALVMAGLMLTGGKLGDIWGRRRAFIIGLCIYGVGSGLTAASWNVPSLMLGWSVLEGIGAALVIPALIALVAGNYKGADRAIAYGVLGGVAGAGIAVGPILGGWATTELSWRVVFVGEVVVAIGILIGTRLIREPEREGPPPVLDWVGGVLSAAGLALVVFGVLQASNWGWLAPRSSPVEPFGFSLVPFVIGAGALVLAGFVAWERRREGRGEDPLVHLPLLRISPLRGGVAMFLAQNLILMGVFFTIPLFLQVVQGLDALETGVRMLPASAGLFFAAIAGSALAKRFAPRPLVRTGLATVVVAILGLLTTIEPELDNAPFLIAMGVLGIGMGLIVSQLGNVVQSAVGDADRSEAGGLQSTAQQLGSSLGTALLGAIVITGLISAFTANVAADERVAADVSKQVETRLSAGGSFVSSDEVRAAAEEEGFDEATTSALIENYEDAQLKALKTAFLFAAFLTIVSFWTTRRLPEQRFDQMQTGPDPPPFDPEPATV